MSKSDKTKRLRLTMFTGAGVIEHATKADYSYVTAKDVDGNAWEIVMPAVGAPHSATVFNVLSAVTVKARKALGLDHFESAPEPIDKMEFAPRPELNACLIRTTFKNQSVSQLQLNKEQARLLIGMLSDFVSDAVEPAGPTLQ